MKKTILLVDTDKEQLSVLMDALRSACEEVNICFAGTMAEAFDMLRRIKPHIILADYNNKPETGLQFLSLIRLNPKFRNTRVYLYSENISDDLSKMAKTLGASGCIVKTTKLNDLCRELKAILNPELLPSYVFFARSGNAGLLPRADSAPAGFTANEQ